MRMLFLSLILTGCPSYPKADKGWIDSEPIPEEQDTSNLPVDTGDPPPPEPPADVGPMGTWSTCSGTFTRNETSYSWSESIDDCELSGEALFEDGVLTLNTESFDDCVSPPWWIEIFEGGPASFVTGESDSRLTLIPTIPVDGGRVAQFVTEIIEERWSLTSGTGNNSWFKLCWTPEGSYFGGMCRALDDACDFLSCGGSISAVERSDEGENWLTRCSGWCPCTGVVTVDERTDSTLTGHFNGSNCAITLSGTFTGVPHL